MHKIVLSILLVALAGNVLANKRVPPKKQDTRTRISSVYVMTGATNYNLGNLNSLANFKKLAPASSIINIPINGTNFYGNSNNYYSSSTTSTIQLGIDIGGKRKSFKYMEARVGFNHISGLSASYFRNSYDVYRVDTLTSAQNGQQYFIDSYFTKNKGMYYTAEMFSFDASCIFKTNPARKFYLYGGIGYSVGTSINTTVDAYYNEYGSRMNSFYSNFSNINSNTYVSTTESFIAPSASAHAWYIPLGINYRISNRNYFFRHVNLVAEARPALKTFKIQDIDFKQQSLMTDVHFGIKIGF